MAGSPGLLQRRQLALPALSCAVPIAGPVAGVGKRLQDGRIPGARERDAPAPFWSPKALGVTGVNRRGVTRRVGECRNNDLPTKIRQLMISCRRIQKILDSNTSLH